MNFRNRPKSEVAELLKARGFTEQMVNTKTATAMIDIFTEDSETLELAKARLNDINQTVEAAKQKMDAITNRFESISDAIKAISKTQDEYGEITDSRAKNALVLYASILALNEKVGANPTESVVGAGYILYAYLGGQARNGESIECNPMSQVKFPEKDDSAGWKRPFRFEV